MRLSAALGVVAPLLVGDLAVCYDPDAYVRRWLLRATEATAASRIDVALRLGTAARLDCS
jgi:hypothetical protein